VESLEWSGLEGSYHLGVISDLRKAASHPALLSHKENLCDIQVLTYVAI